MTPVEPLFCFADKVKAQCFVRLKRKSENPSLALVEIINNFLAQITQVTERKRKI